MTLRIKDWKRFQHFKDRRPPWIKLYRDILDDLEWHELDPQAAKVLVMLWLIASEENGQLPCFKELAFRLRISEKQVESIVSKLSHYLIQPDINPISIGYQSDIALSPVVEERQSRGDCEESPPDIKENGFSPDDMAKLWNEGIEFFEKEGEVLVPKVLKLTDERRKKAAARIKDCQVDGAVWRAVINAVHQSDRLSGRKPSKGYENWKASFDFVIRSQTNLMKILEGGWQ